MQQDEVKEENTCPQFFGQLQNIVEGVARYVWHVFKDLRTLSFFFSSSSLVIFVSPPSANENVYDGHDERERTE
jgi:hypothetical protein